MRTGQRSASYSNAFADKTEQHIGSRSPTTLRMGEFQLEDVLLVIFILNMDRTPNVVEFFILGPSMARVVGSAITTTTPESRTDQYKETCSGRSERKGLNCCQVHLNPDSICSLAHFSDFFFLAVSRPDSGNCHERDGGVYRQHLAVRTHAHFLVAHACARHM